MRDPAAATSAAAFHIPTDAPRARLSSRDARGRFLGNPRIAALSERGKWAGVRLRERFGAAGATRTGLNWNTHRWVRFRTSMMLLQKMLRQTTQAFAASDPDYPSYHDLVNRTADKEPVTGSWWPRTPSVYRDSTRVLEELAATFASSAPDFEEKSPQPGPELRITPRL